MKFNADFHIHSHFSRATSAELVPGVLDYWARLKGLSLLGTGDFTHPGWLRELKESLAPVGEGVYGLKPEVAARQSLQASFLPESQVRFVLSAEISTIYKKNGKVRKVHQVALAPDFETVEKIQRRLTALGGNITSDGRPILGMDSRDLLELLLECHPDIIFIPAHIWTPWFSVLGSKSGFDSLAECFADLTPYIHAVEMGLSTDAPMNWMCSMLDSFVLTAGSDAHSPERLGRNAVVFSGEIDYPTILQGLRDVNSGAYRGVISLFPQEGKYHYDGHRKCGICWSPRETLENRGLCGVCGKPVTVGVMHRVVRLSDRDYPEERPERAPFHSIIPLKEILGEIRRVSADSRKVAADYLELLKKGGPELYVLLEAPLEEVSRAGGAKVAEAVRRMRERRVKVREGYDGLYGVVTVFGKDETLDGSGQELLFQELAAAPVPEPEVRELVSFDLTESRRLLRERLLEGEMIPESDTGPTLRELNPEQLAAVRHQGVRRWSSPDRERGKPAS